jgi:type II secretory pathway pseudopilin PulG
MGRFRVVSGSTGLTLVEVLIALGLLALALTPLFIMFSQSRMVGIRSSQELRATSLAGSMIDGLKRVPGTDLEPIFGQDLTDGQLPSALSLDRLGIPPAHPSLIRKVRVSVVNQPALPGERFSNPWGRVGEIWVTVTRKPTNANPKEELVLDVKGYRDLDD